MHSLRVQVHIERRDNWPCTIFLLSMIANAARFELIQKAEDWIYTHKEMGTDFLFKGKNELIFRGEMRTESYATRSVFDDTTKSEEARRKSLSALVATLDDITKVNVQHTYLEGGGKDL